MTSHHRVLMVGEEGVILYAPEGKGIGREASIPFSAPDFDRLMAQALGEKQMDDAVVVLLNEGSHYYRKEENLPKGECARRLEEAFPAFSSRAVLEYAGPADKGAGNYLFVGMPGGKHIDRVGGALKGAHVPVAGFGVLPVESTGLVAALARKVFRRKGARARWALLAGQHETGGLRHVVIRDGALALTRLIPVPDAQEIGAAAWGEAMVRELKATMGYLRRFGFTDDEGMDAMIVCSAGEKRFFGPNAIAGARLRCLTLAEGLKHLGCRVEGQEGNDFADALHAAWLERAGALKLQVPAPVTAKAH